MKKILITGATGILGSEIIEKTHLKKYKLFGTYNQTKNQENDSRCTYHKLDITDKKAVEDCIDTIKPNCIIHCAAMTNVDECEKIIAVSKVNINGTSYLAEKADEENIKFVYISTDYVFQGKKSGYSDDDERIPVCSYGFSKLQGEKITERLKNSIIARVTIPYTWKKPSTKNNFANWLIDENKNRKEVKVVVDQYNNPTYVPNAAENILKLIERDVTGKFNITGKDCLSRYEFALKIAKAFDLDERLIIPCLTSELNQNARRPVYVNSNTEKAQKLGLEIITAEEGLKRMKGDVIER